MASIGNQSKMNGGFDRLGVVRILLAQVLVLLALAGTAVWYVNWSSEIALREFISADQQMLSSPKLHGQPSAPVQAVKGKTACARRV